MRTGYSFRNAYGRINECLDVNPYGKYAFICDRNSAFGWVEWSAQCAERGLTPVYGLEVNVARDVNSKKPTRDYWTFISTSGIEWLSKVLEAAENNFYREPLLSYEQALEFHKTGIVVAGNCADLDRIPTDMHLALTTTTSRGFFRKAGGKDRKWVALQDNLYPKADDKGKYDAIVLFSDDSLAPRHVLTDEEFIETILANGVVSDRHFIERSINRRNRILADGAKTQIQRPQMLTVNSEKSLYDKCLENFQEYMDKRYLVRLEMETRVIQEKNFEDYFHIMADICQWARERMIVGPARGSAAGSLVCYLLGITTIDPIKYDLLFSRFIDVNRDDLPDIDVDFSDQNREKVFKHVTEKYGKERVARLGSVAMFKARSIVQEGGKKLAIPKMAREVISAALPHLYSGPSGALGDLLDTEHGQQHRSAYPQLETLSACEGHPRHSSQHAAGLVITDKPVRETLPVSLRTGAVHTDKAGAEKIDMLKIDALGLKQLSIFEDILDMIGKPLSFMGEIPLDDQAAFDILNDKKFPGIFQFSGVALADLTARVKHIDQFDDLVALSALARPGPLQSGAAYEWVNIKNGDADARDLLIYQEDIMRICRVVGKLSWPEVSTVRKLMSRSKGTEALEAFRDKFVAGGGTNELWDEMVGFGKYAFNKSHAVSYGVISYWCCWFKAHYPKEFAAASLSHIDDDMTTPVNYHGKLSQSLAILHEAVDAGANYVPFDRNRSAKKWIVDGDDIIAPISNPKGVGDAATEAILGARERGEPVPETIQRKIDKALPHLRRENPFRERVEELMPDPREFNVRETIVPLDQISCNGDWQDIVTVGLVSEIKTQDENAPLAVKRRGYEFKTMTESLQVSLANDEIIMRGKIGRKDMAKLGKEFQEEARERKSIYLIRGTVPPDFKMVLIKKVKLIGEI